jgi:hypothetical protein
MIVTFFGTKVNFDFLGDSIFHFLKANISPTSSRQTT